MTFTGDFFDADGISSVQVVGNSDAGGWTYKDMTNTAGDTRTKALGGSAGAPGVSYDHIDHVIVGDEVRATGIGGHL